MKSYGKVISFDGYCGTIVEQSGKKFLLLDKDIVNGKVEEGDYVEFESEVVRDIEVSKNIARFVKKIIKQS